MFRVGVAAGKGSARVLQASRTAKRLMRTLPRHLEALRKKSPHLFNAPRPFSNTPVQKSSEGVYVPKVGTMEAMDGNTAAAHVAYAMSETSFIYPISPATSMGEMMDNWSSMGRQNVLGSPCAVTVMQSEAGAAGAVHGALAAGGLSSTFTASQGLLLMIPNLYLIAGELMPTVFHISARTVAKHALSIFNDHSDVMACRQTGWAQLCSNDPQEVMDLALVAHLATTYSRIPFMHFFDGNRTSAQINKINVIDYDSMRKLFPFEHLQKHLRDPSLTPIKPIIRGTGQRPDIYFQNLVASHKYYEAAPQIVEDCMKQVSELTGRNYNLFDYHGAKDADRVVICMGSGAETMEETVDYLNTTLGEKVGLVKPRLYRPWSAKHFLAALPESVEKICVLDRTREDGAFGEPLYLDVSATLTDAEMTRIKVIGGQFGLASKEFTPAQGKAVFDNLTKDKPMKRFVVGINDDVTHTSLTVGAPIDTLPTGTKQCMFWGLGTDGTVGANKEAIKTIGSNTNLYTQGHFAYDSHKGGGVTMSHLRFGPSPIKSMYEITENCDYVACHHPSYPGKYDVLKVIKEGGIFALNCPWGSIEELEAKLPDRMKAQIFNKGLDFYTVNASKIALEMGLGQRINTVMQAVFYNLSDVLPPTESVGLLKDAIHKAYNHKGPEVVDMNHRAVDASIAGLSKVEVPAHWGTLAKGESMIDVVQARPGVNRPEVADTRNDLGMYATTKEGSIQFVREIMDPVVALEGDHLPVSSFTPGGYMTASSCDYEKRGIAPEIPVWLPDNCTQCNYCAIVCPHAVIRPFLLNKAEGKAAPEGYLKRKAQGAELGGLDYSIQLATMDCTGCAVCVQQCPDDALYMAPYAEIAEPGIPHWEFSKKLSLKEDLVDKYTVKGSQFIEPLMEFSGACSGCGETPYVKLLTQLYGQRLMIANASGCSSVWGGTSTTNPYTTHTDTQRGPAWGRSLFEDNAEYGFGMVMATQQRRLQVADQVNDVLHDDSVALSDGLRTDLAEWLEHSNHLDQATILADKLRPSLEAEAASNPKLAALNSKADLMPSVSNWIIGGDGWAYDIGYGGLDHVLSKGENCNVLVLDTEMYSNTGGQLSKSTPMSAEVKFASSGKSQNKKDLGQLAMMYENVYVSSVAMGADYAQCVKAFKEAEEYPGTSLIIAYSPCIDWGIDMQHMMQVQKTAVDSGYWPLYRYNPSLIDTDKLPFQLDSRRIKTDLKKYVMGENRFRKLTRTKKDRANQLHETLDKANHKRMGKFQRLAMDDTDLLELLKDKIGETSGEKMTILYASETGTTEQLASQLQYEFTRRGIRVKTAAFDDLDVMDLAKQSLVINLVATCGQGEFPANSKLFYEQIQDQDLPTDLLANTRFCTFGMGDSHYVFFNECAKLIDDQFVRLGGQKLIDVGLGDDQDEDTWETAYLDWEPDLFNEIGAPPPPREVMAASYNSNVLPGEEPGQDVVVPAGHQLCQMTYSKMITPGGRDNRHYEFDVGNMQYACGDSLGVVPHNPTEKVEQFCQVFGVDPDSTFELSGADGKVSTLPKTLSHRQLFGQVLDLWGKPKRRFIDFMSMKCTDEAEVERLNYLLSKEGETELRETIFSETLGYTDMIEMFPSANLDVGYMLDFIPQIKPRLYSIASAQETTANSLHLCVVGDDWTTPSGKYQHGLCSGYLSSMSEGFGQEQPAGFVAAKVNAAAISMPPDQSYPVIMAGLGTGYAPFRAFMQERQTIRDRDEEEVGPMALFFGARSKNTEFLYECGEDKHSNEITEFQQAGILNELHTAFSRDQDHKIYVQDRVNEQSELVYDYIFKRNGYFYLCGPSGPIDAVREAVAQSAVKHGGMNEDDARNMITEMRIKGRYNEETW